MLKCFRAGDVNEIEQTIWSNSSGADYHYYFVVFKLLVQTVLSSFPEAINRSTLSKTFFVQIMWNRIICCWFSGAFSPKQIMWYGLPWAYWQIPFKYSCVVHVFHNGIRSIITLLHSLEFAWEPTFMLP